MTDKEHDDPGNDLSVRADEILCTVLGIEDKRERDAYIDEACAGNNALLMEVNELLSLQEQAERFFTSGSPTPFTATEITQALNDNTPDFFNNPMAALPKDEGVGKQIGNYKLIRKIGEGGVGNVYIAEQIQPVRRQVAFKIIKAGMDTRSVIARFEAERQALAMMEHPNIARVLNAGATETGRPYFVMELVLGERITEYCDKTKLTINQRLKLFIEVCFAIQHAHQKGIIHRDIKPSNVLVTKHDGQPRPIVIDFGIAKATGENLLTDKTLNTSTGPLIGTPAYMSPEQTNLQQMDIDTRTDIYSLGVLLYELLIGTPPFDQQELLNAGIENMCRILREKDPPPPLIKFQQMVSEKQAEIAEKRNMTPHRLAKVLHNDPAWIAMKSMEKVRDHRYASAGHLASDVQRFLNNEPVQARPPSSLYRFRKLVRRNRATFSYVAVIALLLLAGMGTSTWLFIEERNARRNEQKLLRAAETRNTLNQAYLMITRDRPEDAEQLVRKIQMAQVTPSLEATGVYRSLALWNVLRGNWTNAASCYRKLQWVNQLDKSNTAAGMTEDLLGAGPVMVLAGETNEYRRFVHDSIRRFANTTDPSSAERLIKSSLILPENQNILQQLAPLAQVVKSAVNPEPPHAANDSYMAGWRTLALSVYEYRCDHFGQAIYWGKRSLEYSDQTPPRVAMNHIVLAMAYARLGQPNPAREELRAGMIPAEHRFPNDTARDTNLGTPGEGVWHDWVIACQLFREAESLITDQAMEEQ